MLIFFSQQQQNDARGTHFNCLDIALRQTLECSDLLCDMLILCYI